MATPSGERPDGRPGSRRPPRVDQTQVGYEVVSALVGYEVVSALVADPPPSDPAPLSSAAPTRRATDVVFAPRRAARVALGLLLVVALIATAGAAYLAVEEHDASSIGLAVLLGLVGLVLYAVRAGSSSVELSITAGHLELVRSGQRTVVDLTSPFTRLEVVGRPAPRGRPGNLRWKVLIARADAEPLVVDSSMVDPVAFTEAVEAWRPAPAGTDS